MTEDDEIEYSIAKSTDGLSISLHTQTAIPMSQDEFLRALQYFVDRATEEGEDLFEGLLELN